MNTKLSTEQIDEYRRSGVLVYPDLLNDSEVSDLLVAISEALERMGTRKVAGSSVLNEVEEEDDTKDSYYEGVFLQKLNLWKISELVKQTFLGPQLGEMVTTLEGVDGMRVWHDQTLALASHPSRNPLP